MKEIEEHLKGYYTDTLRSYGGGAKGVGWKSDEAQEKRFDQLLKVVAEMSYFSINDLGCGLGDLLDYLVRKQYRDFTYIGYDVLDEMLSRAIKNHRDFDNARFVKVSGAAGLKKADYTVASGVFNLKYSIKEETWRKYIVETLDYMNSNSGKGFSFNMLTKYSDKELMQENLYYADPLFFFDHCKRNYSKNIALLHDYHEYDFTILVRK